MKMTEEEIQIEFIQAGHALNRLVPEFKELYPEHWKYAIKSGLEDHIICHMMMCYHIQVMSNVNQMLMKEAFMDDDDDLLT